MRAGGWGRLGGRAAGRWAVFFGEHEAGVLGNNGGRVFKGWDADPLI